MSCSPQLCSPILDSLHGINTLIILLIHFINQYKWNFLWDTLRLPSSRRAALYMSISHYDLYGARTNDHTRWCSSSPRYTLRYGRRQIWNFPNKKWLHRPIYTLDGYTNFSLFNHTLLYTYIFVLHFHCACKCEVFMSLVESCHWIKCIMTAIQKIY